MRRQICYFAVALFIVGLLAGPSIAQEQQQPKTKEQQEKDALIANVVALRNQEAKVAVLQQLLSEQVMGLRQMQAVFCDQYKLDPEKFRQGLYTYDDKTAKFIEKSALEESAAVAQPVEGKSAKAKGAKR